MRSSQAIRLLGVPLDLGAGRRGVDMGPSALRIAGIGEALTALGHSVEDGGNVSVPQRETTPVGDPTLRYLGPIAQVCGDLYARTAAAIAAGRVPLVLGGDHSLAVGSVAAAADAARAAGGRLGLVWLDAHGDMNTGATSPTGNVHGMPLAALLGDGPESMTKLGDRFPAVDPGDVALIGIRAIDRREADSIHATGVNAYTMRHVDEHGIYDTVTAAVAALKKRGCTRLHVSFDVDFIDPSIAPGVGTRVPGGPTYREAHLVMELLADTGMVTSVDVVELNPCLDRENATAVLSVELLTSLFGKQIL
ncbi:MAG: arginase [Proteobacteria bacterium]|nr:arginase [Pseudomonadota bacterium]